MTAADRTPKAGSKSKLASWFYWHSAFGAVFGLMMFLICWSGIFATLGREIDWLLTPSLRVAPTGPTVSWGRLQEAARRHAPKGVVVQIDAPEMAGFAAIAVVELDEGQLLRVHIDPHTGDVRGTGPLFGVWRFFRSLHANLFGFFAWGRYVVGILGVALLALSITALVFWKRWWRRFFDVRAPRPPVGLWSPVHKLAGVWGLWFALLMGVTGTWYLIDIARFHYVDGRASMTPAPRLAKSGGGEPSLPLDTLVERVRAARPDVVLSQIRFGNGEAPDYFEGHAGYTLVRGRANHVYVDPREGSILAVQHGSDLTAYWRIAETMDPLHFGDFAGLTSRLVWSVFGLVLSASALSGAILMARSARQRGGRPRAAGRSVRWAGLILGLAVIAVAAEGGWAEYVDFSRAAPVPSGVYVVIVGWIAVTAAATAFWFYELR